MLVSSEGILLHQIKYSDHQTIVRAYTRQFGMMSLLVPSGRGRSKPRNFFQTMLPVELQFQMRENRSLCRLHEMHVLNANAHIAASPAKTAQLLFLSELIIKSVREHEKNEALFAFIFQSVQLLEEWGSDLPDFHLKFAIDLSRFLGFYPVQNFNRQNTWFSCKEGAFQAIKDDSVLDQDISKALALLMDTEYHELNTLPWSARIRRSLIQAILHYYQWHLPSVRDLKTPAVLEEVFR